MIVWSLHIAVSDQSIGRSIEAKLDVAFVAFDRAVKSARPSHCVPVCLETVETIDSQTRQTRSESAT